MSAANEKPLIVTGCSGLIGSLLMADLAGEYRVIGLDIHEPADAPADVRWFSCDLTEEDSVDATFSQVRAEFGERIASVVHLAAHYDFSGQPSPLYNTLTVEGTRRLLARLKQFAVEQFVFSSTLLVMKPPENDQPLTAFSPLQAEWDYPKSKLAAEAVIEAERGDVPAVILRIAGVYDEDCHSIPIAQHISRIHQKKLESYFFPGDAEHGQAFVHLDDLVECFRLTIQQRASLPGYTVLLIGEEDVMSYDELQESLGELLHGTAWPTIRIPKAVAKAGAWVKDKLASEDEAEFIKPWMIDLADQHYPINIHRARQFLGWAPRHTLRSTLPEMIRRLKADPRRWYEMNGLRIPDEMLAEHEAGQT